MAKHIGWRAPSLRRGADWLNPFVASPGSALETLAWLESLSPSLMPRTSAMQGVAGGLSVLSAKAVANLAERALPRPNADGSSSARRWAARAATGALGLALMGLDEKPDESLWRSGARTSGRLLRVSSLGGAVHDGAWQARARWPQTGASRALAVSAAAVAGIGVWASRRVTERTGAVEPWPVEQRLTLPASAATTVVTTSIGMGLFRGYLWTRDWWIGYLGRSWPKQVVARALNAGLWAGAAIGGYNAGVVYIGKANERVEPGYAQPPPAKLVSGGPGSVSPFDDLGQQGRRFVTDVITPALIAEVLGTPAVNEPVRVFVGVDSDPLYLTGRAELALEELDRTGAYDRSWLMLASPTGTGWIDQTVIETAELLSGGDIATAAVQYGRYPSFLSIQKVLLARGQLRVLLLGIKERLRERPPNRRPRVVVFGESLGAWSGSDTVMYQGIAGFDHYGIDRALWVGLPGLAKWSRNGMARGSSELVPPGTVVVVDRPEQLDAMSDEERGRLRAVILSHDNDPIARLSPDLLVRRPPWLEENGRGRGVPSAMQWRPLVTFWQTAIDAANAMVTVPGQFKSYGHDYRADMARVVQHAFALPSISDEQLARVETTLRSLEVERAARIKATAGERAPAPPQHRSESSEPHLVGGVPLKTARGARWRRSR